jgi:hypothetical protein
VTERAGGRRRKLLDGRARRDGRVRSGQVGLVRDGVASFDLGVGNGFGGVETRDASAFCVSGRGGVRVVEWAQTGGRFSGPGAFLRMREEGLSVVASGRRLVAERICYRTIARLVFQILGCWTADCGSHADVLTQYQYFFLKGPSSCTIQMIR